MGLLKKIKRMYNSYDRCAEMDKKIDELYDTVIYLSNECRRLRKVDKMSIFKFFTGEELYVVADPSTMPEDASKYIVHLACTAYTGNLRVYKFTAHSYMVIKQPNVSLRLLVKELDFGEHGYTVDCDSPYVFGVLDDVCNFMLSNGYINIVKSDV